MTEPTSSYLGKCQRIYRSHDFLTLVLPRRNQGAYNQQSGKVLGYKSLKQISLLALKDLMGFTTPRNSFCSLSDN